MIVDLAVRRQFAPDARATWVRYTVDATGRATVLDALISIASEQDSTLAFRAECRSGICGACGGLVNGRPRLFCQTSLTDALGMPDVPDSGAPIAVAPLAPLPVLRDLVVDVDGFFEAFRRAETWIEPSSGYSGLLSPEVAERAMGAARCILCALCANDPPPEVPEPAVAARLLRIARDPRDARGVDRLTRLGPYDPRRHAEVLSSHLALCCPAAVDVRRLAREPQTSAAGPSTTTPGDTSA